jgi:dTDP-4-amino-4,6-dideoxygalactose transaminase
MSHASKRVGLADVTVGQRERQLVNEVLDSGRLAQGPMVDRLEAAFCKEIGTEHAVAVNSGTTALIAALTAHEIGRGDEVIVSPLTFGATLNAVLAVGATARFADIDDTYTMSPDSFAELINDRTRAVMPVHLYGLCADMPAIEATAHAHDVVIIEDAAQAIGAEVADRAAGTWGTGCFSLYATKNVMAGEGGMITTDDGDIASRLRILRNQGMQARYDYVTPGLNWRLSDLHAAVGVGQMDRLQAFSERRRKNAQLLDLALADVEWIETPPRPPGRVSAFHQYTVRIPSGGPIDRAGAQAALDHAGVDTGVIYPRVVYDYECFRSHPDVVADPVPLALAAAKTVLSLPVHPGVTEADIARIANVFRMADKQAA